MDPFNIKFETEPESLQRAVLQQQQRTSEAAKGGAGRASAHFVLQSPAQNHRCAVVAQTYDENAGSLL